MDFDAFPRAMAELQDEFKFKSLVLSFLRGRWKYDFWGLPLMTSASQGIQLDVQLGEGDNRS